MTRCPYCYQEFEPDSPSQIFCCGYHEGRFAIAEKNNA